MFDLELKNCIIYGYEGEADTVGIRHGRIVEVGTALHENSARTIDLEGRTLIPGYIDSHTHLLNLGLSMVRLDLSGARSRQEALDMAMEYGRTHQSGPIVGYGWDETLWGEKDYISRMEIDFTERPVVLYRKDMHMASANSSALRITGLNSPEGIVKEENLRKLENIVKPDHRESAAALEAAIRHALSEGITTVRDIMLPDTLSLVRKMNPPLRIFHMIYGSEYGGQDLSGPDSWGIKLFLDGSIGAKTAAHGGWAGNLKISDGQLSEQIANFWNMGIPVAMHAIGEEAVAQAVRVLREQRGYLRNSIEHFELVREEDLDGISTSTAISSQPNFLQWSMENGLYHSNLGSDWYGRDNPFRDILDRGLNLAFGSDCMPMSPGYGIGLAVTSGHSRQRISLNEAIDAYTSGGAYILHEENLSGRIGTGFRADLAIFDEGYLTDPAGIWQKKPQMTIVGGNIAYSRLHGE